MVNQRWYDLGQDYERSGSHDMRHSFASILLNALVSADKVARWLGHADTRMVHKTYGHLLAYDEEIDRLGGGEGEVAA